MTWRWSFHVFTLSWAENLDTFSFFRRQINWTTRTEQTMNPPRPKAQNNRWKLATKDEFAERLSLCWRNSSIGSIFWKVNCFLCFLINRLPRAGPKWLKKQQNLSPVGVASLCKVDYSEPFANRFSFVSWICFVFRRNSHSPALVWRIASLRRRLDENSALGGPLRQIQLMLPGLSS